MNKTVIKKISLLSVTALSALALTACDGESGGGDSSVEFNQIENNGLTPGEVETYSYAGASYGEKAEILGALEKYIMDTNLAGIPLYENGSTVMYKEAIKKVTNTSIPGFGYGILSYGEITEDLDGESTDAWKRYYHSYTVTDDKSVNYWDESGSSVSTYSSYVHGTYFSQQLNDSRDAYSYGEVLAGSDVELINAVNGMSDTFRFEVQVGEDVRYSTLSTDPEFSKFNNREVVLEDYLTSIKELHNQSNALYRGSQTLTDASSMVGLEEYYNATKNGFDQTTWDNVGVKAYVENGKSYLEFQLNQPANAFYAKYYVNSTLYTPLPAEFITAVGGMKNYGTFSSDNKLSPVDTSLSTGPYVMEEYVNDSHFVFKKNPNYVLADTLYKIEGVHYNVLAVAGTSSTAAWEEYQADKLHSVSIPSVHLAEFGTHKEATKVDGSVTWKLNVNVSTQEEWIKLFGTNGSVSQTSEANYWQCEPAMGNTNFVNGLYHSINRLEFANNRGSVASGNILANAYLINPEDGISYNNTQAHIDAVSNKINADTDAYGYSLTYAKTYFKRASEELIAAGAYSTGDEISIDVMWFNESLVTSMGVDVAKYFTDAFNSCGGGLTLKVNNIAPSADESIYDYLDNGQFDLAMGAVSGNAWDPLSFLDVWKSDNSSGWTMNWGYDTSINDGSISYDNKTWSYNALFDAATTGANVVGGEVSDFGVLLQESLNDGTNRNLTLAVVIPTNIVITNVQVVGTKNGSLVTVNLTDWALNDDKTLLTGSFAETADNYITGNATILITYTINGVERTRSVSTTFVK